MVASKFGTKVVDRWTRFRAKNFFEGFVESLTKELQTGIESKDVDETLEKILDDDVKSEVLFDAYRSVCFSKSKTLGPKIVGLLTGRLVAEGRSANENEADVFRAAESLSDGDLIALFKEFWIQSRVADALQDPKKNAHWVGDAIVIPWSEETRDSAWQSSREAEIDVSPLNFTEVFGPWGGNVSRLGLLTSTVLHREEEYEEDSERHIDQNGLLSIYSWTITFEPPCRELCVLIERALGASAHDHTTTEHSKPIFQ
jgi:hypothetical protein